jgi:hypothetical protein
MMVTNVSFYVVLSFLKTIMIVRVTYIVVSYRKWSREQLVNRALKKREESLLKANNKKKSENDRKKKSIPKPLQKNNQNFDQSTTTIQVQGGKLNSSSKVLSIQRLDTSSGDASLGEQFKKQTKLESHVTLLTIKRTMTCFFAIIFSVPFFISTTYKSFLTEFEPISHMIVDVRNNSTQSDYINVLNFVVSQHKDDFDELVGLEAPNFIYKSEDYSNDDIRDLHLFSIKTNGIEFTVDLTNTIKLYAICGIGGYIISGVLLVAFVIYINKDLSTYVIFPLESMYEKVVILSKNPMAATSEDFATKTGIASLLQSNSASQAQDEIHLIDKSIMKIAYLLAVGYGEAGTSIIINNMSKKRGMDIDIPGQKIIGIYGF